MNYQFFARVENCDAERNRLRHLYISEFRYLNFGTLCIWQMMST